MDIRHLINSNIKEKFSNISKIKHIIKQKQNVQEQENIQKNSNNEESYNYNITEENQTINSLLSDKNVPKEIIRKYWWIFTRDTTLTFLDKERKKAKLLAFDIIKIDTLNSLPYYEYTFEIEKEMNAARNLFDTKLDRALGTMKSSQLNERIVQRSQFSENRNINSADDGQGKAGFISKLLSRR